MAHYAILSPPFAGHLVPILMIGHRLLEKGHRITLVSDERARSVSMLLGLEFVALPAVASSTIRRISWRRIRPIERVLRLSMRHNQRQAAIRWMADAPGLIASLGVDALIVEQYVVGGGSIAEYLGLPFATVSGSLDFQENPAYPPSYTPWAYSDALASRLRNQLGYRAMRWFMAPILSVINDWRRRHGLGFLHHHNEFFSRSAHIVQGCAEFDFPQPLVTWRHYGGCLTCDQSRPQVNFVWDRLDDRPLVFASFGTLYTRKNLPMLELVARVCAKLPVQLVLTRGKWNEGEGDLPNGMFDGDPIAVDFAPQLRLLERAALMVSHGGNNSTMEALAYGVPQIICPRSADQPGVAARAVRAGVALVHPFGNLSESRLRYSIERVLNEDAFRQRAQGLKHSLAATGGSQASATFIERALQLGFTR